MNEKYYEELLNIDTCKEQEGFNDSIHYNRYEATPYSALKELFSVYAVHTTDNIVDYGCGKGRLLFYINYFFKATVTGIEMDINFYNDSLENKKLYLQKYNYIDDKITFLNCYAEKYKISKYNDKFYFFNPFSIQIFMKIIDNIYDSLEENERTVDLILYYPSEDFIYYLDNCTNFTLYKEVKLKDLYYKDNRERFLIYRLELFK